MNKLNFNDFLKKINFILGDKIKIDEIKYHDCDIYHIREFDNLSDEHFIEEMYSILLRRIYDEPGKNSKLNEIINGKKRIQIIKDMINSEEGQNYKDVYEFLGIDYSFNFIVEDILYKSKYDESNFESLILFLNFRFSKLPNNIIDLLSYSGSEFVFLLYKILLRRDPDLIGFNHHLRGSYLLEDKFNKIKDFLISDEAKSKGINFYDLNNKSLLDIENMEEIFSFNEEIKKLNRAEVIFNDLLNDSLYESILLLSSICISPKNCFTLISKKIFLEGKTIIEVLYEYEILDLIEDKYLLIDFFNKIIRKNNFSIIDDVVRNNSYYISWYQARLKEYFVNFNFIKNLVSNLDRELFKIVKFLKKFALKEDLNNLYKNDKFLEENINILSDILKEHEEFILNFSNTKNNQNMKVSRRNRSKKKKI